MKPFINNDWWPVLEPEFEQPYYSNLSSFINHEYQNENIHPDHDKIFEAFEWTSFDKTKVVILGQDPYHENHQAHGLSFSVMPGVKVPPSLRNIYKELDDDLGFAPVNHGYLESWARQGVLLLNTVLTVQDGVAFSHQGKGWEKLTDAAIIALSERTEPVIFVLWGKAAQDKIKLIDTMQNVVIKSAHPSPLSAYRGFFGSRPFSKVNAVLRQFDEKEIDWQLPESVEEQS